MRIIIEDYNGDDLYTFDVNVHKHEILLPVTHTIKRPMDCNIHDVVEDQSGIRQVRIQLTDKRG